MPGQVKARANELDKWTLELLKSYRWVVVVVHLDYNVSSLALVGQGLAK